MDGHQQHVKGLPDVSHIYSVDSPHFINNETNLSTIKFQPKVQIPPKVQSQIGTIHQCNRAHANHPPTPTYSV